MPTRIYTGPSIGSAPQRTIALGTFEDLIMTRGALLAPTEGAGVIGLGDGHRLAIAGDIAASEQGISLTGNGNTITITASGSIISAESAIAIGGDTTRITNYGELTTFADFAINLTNVVSTNGPPPAPGFVRVLNNGTINGGIASTGNILGIENTGLIVATGLVAIQTGDLNDSVRNSGTIRGQIQLGDGVNQIINRGTITGAITTGAGVDFFDNSRGLEVGFVFLGAGSDTYRPGQGIESVSGQSGTDTLDFAVSGPVTVALDGTVAGTGTAADDSFSGFENVTGSKLGSDVLNGDGFDNVLNGLGGNDELSGRGGDDKLIGDTGNDQLRGEFGSDSLSGGLGNDMLFGGDGNDSLIGSSGNDSLDGGAGADVLIGGLGTDTFRFGPDAIVPASLPFSTDVIKDFAAAEGDKIDLSAIDAIVGNLVGPNPVNDAFTWIGNTKFSKQAGELRYGVSLSGYVLQGDVNGDGIADFAIKLAGVNAISVADITL